MGRPKSPVDTGPRAELLEAAIRIIDEHGEAALRVRELADEVGVAVTAVYYYFRSREGMVDAANIERYRRAFYGPLHDEFVSDLARCTSRADLRPLLRGMIARYHTPGGIERRRIRKSVLGSAMVRPALAKQVAAFNAEYAHGLAVLFAEPQRLGWVRQDVNLEVVAMWAISQMTNRAVVELQDAPFDVAEYDRIEADAMFAALLGPDPDGDVPR